MFSTRVIGGLSVGRIGNVVPVALSDSPGARSGQTKMGDDCCAVACVQEASRSRATNVDVIEFMLAAVLNVAPLLQCLEVFLDCRQVFGN